MTSNFNNADKVRIMMMDIEAYKAAYRRNKDTLSRETLVEMLDTLWYFIEEVTPPTLKMMEAIDEIEDALDEVENKDNNMPDKGA